MDKETIKKLKEKLQKEKKMIEKELVVFADKNLDVKGDWKTKFPEFDLGDVEERANAVEEFVTRLSLEKRLELKLKKIDLALEKIKKNKYGICENCEKAISQKRLNICPDAKMCGKCVKK
ncbi:MAG: hypothetical protein U9Q27_03065 [Patescibacteria group bacterium]|nr:hypothetical protein [Patescibacteria group bacterium]